MMVLVFSLGTTKELPVPNSGQLEAESAKVQGASRARIVAMLEADM